MRRGFTLVEMLVATALVMLMMLLFAEVFGAAVGTITAQKGLTNNDQKARSLVSVLKHDLDNRTYRASDARGATKIIAGTVFESPRGVVPLSRGDNVDEAAQRGYLYISENDPDDDTDDVLQITVLLPPTTGGGVPAPFYGRANDEQLAPAGQPNQPERDDGIAGDDAATSQAAEIEYFLRGGNLYRRYFLIRQPPSASPEFTTQPQQNNGQAFAAFEQPYPGGGSFYRDWDFSGTRVFVSDPNGSGAPFVEPADTYRFHFHGLESLDNLPDSSSLSLGVPWHRSGFYSRFGISRPVEYVVDGLGNRRFIGRFTHEETSDAAFTHPGVEAGQALNMMARADLLLSSPDQIVSIDTNNNGAYDLGIDQVLTGANNRIGEDVLLTNVEAWDIEVFDPLITEDDNLNGSLDAGEDRNFNGVIDVGGWIDLGHSNAAGHFQAADRTRSLPTDPFYGPRPDTNPAVPLNRVFDTWHSDAGIDLDGNGTIEEDSERSRPPFRPLQVTVPDIYAWNQAASYSLGDVFLPDALGVDGAAGIAGVDDDNDGNMDVVAGVPDTDELEARGSDDNMSIGYIVTAVSGAGNRGATEPEWTRAPGTTRIDQDLTWQSFDNRIGLDRIRITVRYRDVGTGQSRQVTFVHALVD